MSLGAILVGIAVVMAVAAYISQPFRRVTVNPDDVIEAWIKQYPYGRLASRPSNVPLPDDTPPPTPSVEAPSPTPSPVRATRESPLPNTDTQINFCPQCGRKVAPDHRFCPGCGYQLPREEAEV